MFDMLFMRKYFGFLSDLVFSNSLWIDFVF